MPPRPTTAPLLPPSHTNPYISTTVNTSNQGTTPNTSNKPIEAELIDTEPTQQSSNKPVDQTKCRQAIIQKAKDNATKFLGKFVFGENKLTEVLPPVIQEPATFRDSQFKLEKGENSRQDTNST